MPSKYKTIDGRICERELLDLGVKVTKEGRLELSGARELWENALDGNKITERERNAINHIMKHTRHIEADALTFFDFWLNDIKRAHGLSKIKGGGVEKVLGVKCDAAMLQVAQKVQTNVGRSSLGIRGAEAVWFCALDGKGVTNREKETLKVILRNYDFDGPAELFLQQKVDWLEVAADALDRDATARRSKSQESPDGMVLSRTDAIALSRLAPPMHTRRDAVSAAQAPPPAKRLRSGSSPAAPAGFDVPQPAQLAIGNCERGGVRGWMDRLGGWMWRPFQRFDTPALETRGRTLTSRPSSFAPARALEDEEQAVRGVKRKAPEGGSITIYKLREIFDRCDQNADGQINKRELIRACRQDKEIAEFFELPQTLRQEDGSRSQFEELFQDIDKDSDREIRWVELLAYYKHIVEDM